MRSLLSPDRNTVWLIVVFAFALVPRAQAEIRQINATVSAEVQEFVAGEEGSFDSAFEEYGETSSALPLMVVARLLPDEGATTNGFVANAFADFRDPSASATHNPSEFGLETTAYSRAPDVRFANRASASENRRVVFSPTELDLQNDETKRPVISSVFISGAVAVWSEDAHRDLTGLSANLRITIEQQLPEEVDPIRLFEALLTVRGVSDGTIAFDSPDDIFAIMGGPELIAATADFTEDQLLEELAGLGNVYLVLIPEQELLYMYDAVAGVEFDLKATVEVQASNLPGGTGVAAVFGRPFEALAHAVSETARAQTKGAATQAAVNAALADTEVTRRIEPAGAAAVSTGGSLCGAIGIAALAMTFALLLGAVGVRRLQ